MENLKVLIYGDIDINIIDGSSIWITSIINVLSNNKNIKIDYLLKKSIKNNTVIKSIYNIDEINIINPFNLLKKDENKLTPTQVSSCIELLDKEKHYNCIIVRGMDICKKVCEKQYLRNKIISYIIPEKNSVDTNDISKEEKEKLAYIYSNSKYLFSQTEESKNLLKKLLNINSDEKFIILPPMIPKINKEEIKFMNERNRLIYSGKFCENWNTEKILNACEEIISSDESVSLTIVGNKFNKDIASKEDHIIDTLENNKYINWVSGVSRQEVFNIMKFHDIGIAWRSKKVDNDNSIEISTKVLEYASLGIPVILNRSKIHEKLFGSDYPLFIEDDKNDFIEKLKLALYDSEIYMKCSHRVYNSVQMYTFQEIYNSIHLKLWSFKREKVNLLFVGHDFKFIDRFIEYCRNSEIYDVKIDKWKGHNTHDELYSKECINWADVIFCEWGLGNAVWYSNNKLKYQKLIVRIHSQERRSKFYEKFNIDNIDTVITITPYMFEEVSNLMNIPRNKIKMIFNYVDFNKFDKNKDEKAIYNLGMIGMCPKSKRLDLAIDILEKLIEKDNRYKLYIKGKQPAEYSWLMAREDERVYYENLFKRINNSIYKENIVFDGFSKDVDVWFSKIGYILSTSDLEGSHVSVAEGIASGSVPIIFNWDGADTIYQSTYICKCVDDAVEMIIKNSSKIEDRSLKEYAKEHFDINKIIKEIEKLFY